MLTFNSDEYKVTVLNTRDQYNDYSVKFDVTVRVEDLVKGNTWTQLIVASGEDLNTIQRAFRHYNEQGWIRSR